MARPIRIEFPGALYHVMSRGVAGMASYMDDNDRVRFLNGVGALIEAGVLIVHSFCLMTNHFHLLCETPIGKLGRWMHQLLSQYSRNFNQCHSRFGHLWQARYKAILVEPGEHLLYCSRYIHLNPVRAAMVRCAEEYIWSSYRSYLALDSVVDWVSKERLLGEAGGPYRYKSFVELGLESEDESPFERAAGGVIFGGKKFVEQMRALIRQPKRRADLSGYASLNRLGPPSLECLQTIVDDVMRDYSRCQRRRSLSFVLRRFYLMKGREIAKLMGISEASVSETCRDMEKRLAVDEHCADQVNELGRRLLQTSS